MTVAKALCLHGYRYSVYTRIVRVVLAEKALAHETHDVNPFEPDRAAGRNPHPFGLVPVLSHGDFRIYETSAITRYLDTAFPCPPLTPLQPKAVARMAQVIAMVDAYAYRPMVRQVFEHGVFRPAAGETRDETEFAAGLQGSGKVLAALEEVASEGLVLATGQMTLADCHLAPVFCYFTAAPEGRALLAGFPALSRWWADIATRSSLIRTEPGLPRPETVRP